MPQSWPFYSFQDQLSCETINILRITLAEHQRQSPGPAKSPLEMHLKEYECEAIAMTGRRVGDEQATGHTCDPSEAIKRTGGDGRLYSQPLLEQLTWPRTAATITINFRLEILTQNYINDAMSFAAVDGDHIPVVFLAQATAHPGFATAINIGIPPDIQCLSTLQRHINL
ncbi:hypothetical protein ASPWEDRAFT_404088 [Aspergillus wentii DTO 134E9]|uniref:Uncharacterized protein n=1 Tax=Aspergillus wentii DTO 134E9 TaxID=1073089 RepID=A0A1L9RMX4_ASPWE|nr:uncharacterized protein ASPWEDRAFT_404088 [Aspergillus wentii DTO 134E9]OJJ36300.1 hypothetical protein ASPWEDRAFT_404088 [Aspergillus wentii DTO 134E9]